MFRRCALESIEVEVRRPRNPANQSSFGAALALAAVNDPLEHPHVIAKTRPEKFPIGTLAKPVYVKDEWRIRQTSTDFKPVLEVIAHAISAKGQHCHRVTSHLTNRARRGSGGFRSHGRADINAVSPIHGAKNQRHRVAPASAENDRTDRHALSLFDVRIEHRIVPHRNRETAIGMRCFLLRLRRPTISFPVEARSGRGILSFPPDIAVVGQRDIRKERIPLDRLHRIWV